MSHEQDWQAFRAAIRITRDIFRQPALAPYSGYEISPGKARVSDADLDAFVRARAAGDDALNDRTFAPSIGAASR